MVHTMGWDFRQLPFWERVSLQIVVRGECHIFTGAKDSSGYGRIADSRFGPAKKKLVRLHRAVWERDFGKIPDGMNVCHTCDTPACINPKHLFVGDQQANVRDMWSKGRAENLRRWGNANTKGKHFNVGSAHGRAIFTEDQVREIKKSLALDNTYANVLRLAEKNKCSRTAINHIRNGTRWRHVQ